MCLTPLSSSGGPNDSTERAQIKSYLMEIDITVDGGGDILDNTLLLCRGMRKTLSFVLIWLARPKILEGPKHGFLSKNGTNGREQPRSVPSGSSRSNRVKTRPQPILYTPSFSIQSQSSPIKQRKASWPWVAVSMSRGRRSAYS